MTNETNRLGMQARCAYRITVEGWIAARWKDWFNGMAITLEGGGATQATSTLQGVVSDQAALLGLLHHLYNLGFPLLTLERLANSPADLSVMPDGHHKNTQSNGMKNY